MRDVVYTVWTIPRSAWSNLFADIKLTEANKESLIQEFAKLRPKQDVEMGKRLEAFRTRVTSETLLTVTD